MVLMNASLRLLRPFKKNINLLNSYNSTVFRTIVSYTNSCNVQVPKFEQRRGYAELATNIIKSPYKFVEIPEVLVTDIIWSRADNWLELTAVVSNTYIILKIFCYSFNLMFCNSSYILFIPIPILFFFNFFSTFSFFPILFILNQ